MSKAPTYKAFAKLYIAADDGSDTGAFGSGLAALLRGVRESGSLNRAAKDMHMAYSKAWKLMNNAETNLGVQLIERDGARGSTLTAEGERILNCFDTVSSELNSYANELLQRELGRR